MAGPPNYGLRGSTAPSFEAKKNNFLSRSKVKALSIGEPPIFVRIEVRKCVVQDINAEIPAEE
jgi:hypothetical protein